MARMDDFLRPYGYTLERPTRRLAVSPRAREQAAFLLRVRRLVWWLTRWGR